MSLLDDTAADLERDEGRVPHVYLDSLGYQTIGVGHLVDARLGGGLPPDIITGLRDYDIVQAMARLDLKLPWWRQQPANVQRGMLNMEFQLRDRLLGFTDMLGALQAKDYNAAQAAGKASNWFVETPARAIRVLTLFT